MQGCFNVVFCVSKWWFEYFVFKCTSISLSRVFRRKDVRFMGLNCFGFCLWWFNSIWAEDLWAVPLKARRNNAGQTRNKSRLLEWSLINSHLLGLYCYFSIWCGANLHPHGLRQGISSEGGGFKMKMEYKNRSLKVKLFKFSSGSL